MSPGTPGDLGRLCLVGVYASQFVALVVIQLKDCLTIKKKEEAHF